MASMMTLHDQEMRRQRSRNDGKRREEGTSMSSFKEWRLPRAPCNSKQIQGDFGNEGAAEIMLPIRFQFLQARPESSRAMAVLEYQGSDEAASASERFGSCSV